MMTTTSSCCRGGSARSNIVIVVVAVALIAGMVGWLIADSGSDVASSDVDIGFLQDMSEHHRQAVDMSFSFLARPDTDPRLQTVAERSSSSRAWRSA